VPAAMLRKVIQSKDGGDIEVWGDGRQSRSFLYIDACIDAVLNLMHSDFSGPVNIGSEEMVTINQLAEYAIEISGKSIRIRNLMGDEFLKKYGYPCPVGVNGRNSDNRLFQKKVGESIEYPLFEGLTKTYHWIKEQVDYPKNKIA